MENEVTTQRYQLGLRAPKGQSSVLQLAMGTSLCHSKSIQKTRGTVMDRDVDMVLL